MSKKYGSLSPQEIKRLQGGEMILDGYDNEEIAEILGVVPRTVQRWRQKLKEEDNIQALVRKEGSGHPSLLTDKQKQQLKKIILGGAVNAGYSDERWTSKIVADLIQKKFDTTMAARTVRNLLPTLGLSPQMPVVKSHKHSDERWTSKIVADLIQKKFGITMAPRTVRSLLPTLGLSPQMPVVKSHKHSDEEVLRWATRTWTRLKKKRNDLVFP
jgi:transposase